MYNIPLKRIRLGFSILMFILLSIPFIDFTGLVPVAYTHLVTWPQFIPSLLQFIEIPVITGLGFLFIILLTLTFGRVYCSWICPLGVLQDFFNWIRRKTSKRKHLYKYRTHSRYLAYGLLILITVLFIARINIALIYTDPFSIYGRMANHLFMPVMLGLNNAISNLLGSSGYYGLKPYPYQGFDLFASSIALFFLMIIGFISLTRARLYCTDWCPAGSLLGLFSKFSHFKIYLDHSNCNECGLCSSVCKSECIDSKNKEVDFDLCVGCFNCISVCRQNGVRFGKSKRRISANETTVTNPKRREFIAGLLTFSLIPSLHGKESVKSHKAFIKAGSAVGVSPPGALNNERFSAVCTACHLCLSACPTRVLQPSFLQYGLKGMLQPFMDYHSNFCNYECTRCSEVCPSGALLPVNTEEKKRIQLGKAKFVEKNCVVYTDGTACGACSEHCPTKAVDMVFYKPGLTIPEVTEDICIGCGACEYACPTMPYKAIYVEANALHQVAKEPKGSDKSKEEVPEEFPF